MWNGNTSWRQSSTINVEVLRSFNPGLVRGLNEDVTHLCAISSDGDIANDNMMLEPVVEFVGCKLVEPPSPEFTNAKHPSVLHLPCYLESQAVVLELRASPKTSISKHNLIQAMQPDKKFFFDDNAKAILQSWLSLRYRRKELPEAFIVRTRPLWEYLKSEGKKYALHAMGYWLDYDPEGEELNPSVPYTFSLYIVHSIRHHDAQDQSEKLAIEIRNLFPQWQKDAEAKELGKIELKECRAYAEDCFTLSDLQNCVQFDLSQLNSYKE